MRRLAPAPLLVLALCSVTAAAAAEFSPLVADPPSAKPTAPAATTRVVSPVVGTMLGNATPKFEAVTPASPVASEPAAEDKPRNGIIRLPTYEVREGKLPNFKERELLTPAARLELAYKRHPGLRFGSFGPLSNKVWAEAFLEEELSIERQQEMFDLLGLLPGRPRSKPIIRGSVPFSLPIHFSGPEAGLVVPWERR